METAYESRWVALPTWSKTLASLLPLWLVSLAIMAEGFPRPPVSVEMATVWFVLAIVVSIVLLWQRWVSVEVILYSFIPFGLMIMFDEISTAYKTPFIVLCAVILSAGIVGYQLSQSAAWRVFILVAAAALTLVLAGQATANFWQMASALGYERCFPDAQGCAALTDQAPPWWALFFGG